jgi:DNA-binding transcriptional MerR regulator
MDEETIPDLLDALRTRAERLIKRRTSLRKRLFSLNPAETAVLTAEIDFRGVDLEPVRELLEQLESDFTGEIDELTQMLETIKQQFEEYVDQYRRERDTLAEAFDSSSEQLRALLQESEL